VGVGRHGRCVEEAGHEQGRCPCRPVSGARPAAGEDERRGEADGWATTTVSGGGATDERGPSGSGRGRGREERGTDRWDRPVNGCEQRGGYGLRGARVGWPGKGKKGGSSPDEW
jgi:hypothetical protein